MTLADALYRAAPTAVQHGLVSAYGWWWKRLRFGGNYRAEVAAYRARERYDAQQWRDHATAELRRLLALAVERAPHYRAAYADLSLTPDRIAAFTLDDLPTLPVLDKAIARDAPYSLLLGGKPARDHHAFHTSGSTGTPVTVYWRTAEFRRSLALREARSNGWAGVSFDLARATFSGRMVVPDPASAGPYHRYNIFERQVYFSAFHLKPHTADRYLDALRRHHTQWMTGYSHSIYQLAQLALDHNFDAPPLKAVITTSEKLTPQMRAAIEQAFQTRCYEEYAAVEDLFYVSQCEAGSLHVSPDAGILEIVDGAGQPLPPGEMGRVVVTGFVRPSQPMIRYSIGDFAIIDAQPCACGRAMPVLREVVGRLEDTVFGPDGRRMVRFHGIFISQPNVAEGQIVQHALDRITVRIVPKAGFGEKDIADIASRVRQRLGESVTVAVETVPALERTAAGKSKGVISYLTPEEIRRQIATHEPDHPPPTP